MLKVRTETPRFGGKSRYTTIYYVDGEFSGCKMHIGTKVIGYNKTEGIYHTVKNIARYSAELAYIKDLIKKGGIRC